jgi:hypothetical protein
LRLLAGLLKAGLFNHFKKIFLCLEATKFLENHELARKHWWNRGFGLTFLPAKKNALIPTVGFIFERLPW